MSIVSIVAAVSAIAVQNSAFKFNGVEYFHRYTKGNLREYTPKSQTDFAKWTDMVTVNEYPSVKTGDDLAKAANAVLSTYKDQKAVVVRTNSVPRSAKKEAEHLIVVAFPRPEFIEAAFTRFVILDGKGYSIVYSHRIYSKKAGDQMSKWLSAYGEPIEKALMEVQSIPK